VFQATQTIGDTVSAPERSPRDRIFEATLACIERDGLDRLTVRAIAREAGVNVAAVNYYFGSKAQLVQLALDQTRHHGFWESLDELKEEIANQGGDVRVALTMFLEEFVGNMVRWPRLAAAQFHDAFNQQDYSGHAVADANAFLGAFLDVVRPALPPGDEADLKASVQQFWSSLFLLALFPKLFESFSGMDVTNDEQRRRYVRRLVLHFLPDEAASE